jgi:uncharacterized protein with ParB-like and HNH nuclease domain
LRNNETLYNSNKINKKIFTMTNDNIDIIDDDEDDYSNDDLFNITSWGADLSFRELISMYEDDELQKPELQRNYVWEKAEASRFIESILLWLPIPSIFLANTKDNNKLIIDGYQRIMTVYDYVSRGIFANDGKVFKLVNTQKINEKWRGKAYTELEDFEQKKIRQTTIHTIIFEQRHPKNSDTSLYQVFERINTSGKALKPQEIRNCVYQGSLNSLLIELNQNSIWRKLYWSEENDARMADMEYILRFFALSSRELIGKNSGQISLKLFLNTFMGNKAIHDTIFIENKREEFLNLVKIIDANFGENAFRNYSNDSGFIKKFHPTIYDSVIISTNYALSKNIDIGSILDIKEKHLALLKNEDFKKFTTIRTTNYDSINGRINLACSILYGISYE